MTMETGNITTLIGTAVASAMDNSQRSLQAGDDIFHGEIITTGPSGAIEIEFVDGSVMNLGRSSQAIIDNDVFNLQDLLIATSSQGLEVTDLLSDSSQNIEGINDDIPKSEQMQTSSFNSDNNAVQQPTLSTPITGSDPAAAFQVLLDNGSINDGS